jgi:hypothetical protein
VFPEIDDLTIAADTTEVNITLPNPDCNDCLLTFEIILADTGETLYLSERIEPGGEIGTVTFAKPLGEGEYNAKLHIRAFGSDDQTEIEDAIVEFTIIAK